MGRTFAGGSEIFVDEFNFSGVINAIAIDVENPISEITAFTDGDATFVEGKPTFSITLNGLYSTSSPDYDGEMFNDLTSSDRLITVSPGASATSGGLAYFGRGDIITEPITSNIGDAVLLNVTWKGNKPLARGTFMHRDAGATASADGTAYNLGAITASQQLISFLHVLSATVGTLNVTIESDAASTFGTPTTVLTFTQVASTITAERQTVSGAITDTWYRAHLNITGFASYDMLVSLGIASYNQ